MDNYFSLRASVTPNKMNNNTLCVTVTKERQLAAQQEACIEQWAKAVGCWTEQMEAAENRALALR